MMEIILPKVLLSSTQQKATFPFTQERDVDVVISVEQGTWRNEICLDKVYHLLF